MDNDPRFCCDVTADLRDWTWDGPRPDLIWLSDPCTEFARESMPWSRTGAAPDLSIFFAGLRVIREARPRYWIRENVRGSVRFVRPYVGAPREIHFPFFLWGDFPALGTPLRRMKPKESYAGRQQAERAKIPAALSLAVAVAVEQQARMFDLLPDAQIGV